MTNLKNAEKLYMEYVTRPGRKNKVNICLARKNWNGCDFCDVYAGNGQECWKQDGKHNCVFVIEEERK